MGIVSDELAGAKEVRRDINIQCDANATAASNVTSLSQLPPIVRKGSLDDRLRGKLQLSDGLRAESEMLMKEETNE